MPKPNQEEVNINDILAQQRMQAELMMQKNQAKQNQSIGPIETINQQPFSPQKKQRDYEDNDEQGGFNPYQEADNELQQQKMPHQEQTDNNGADQPEQIRRYQLIKKMRLRKQIDKQLKPLYKKLAELQKLTNTYSSGSFMTLKIIAFFTEELSMIIRFFYLTGILIPLGLALMMPKLLFINIIQYKLRSIVSKQKLATPELAKIAPSPLIRVTVIDRLATTKYKQRKRDTKDLQKKIAKLEIQLVQADTNTIYS